MNDFINRPLIYPDTIAPIIPEDEPVFLLRAKDRFAPLLVRRWAEYLYEYGPHATIEQLGHPAMWCDTCATIKRAREWADEMERYADERYGGGKVPDVPLDFLEADHG
ncbi:MAG TPA: hypothetical protein VM328_11015 [Fimbriimonadaceae bacterium]|nr:hypothetical protein [Fimbriimonadaceae bacterium]